jgi:hypothetical protein
MKLNDIILQELKPLTGHDDVFELVRLMYNELSYDELLDLNLAGYMVTSTQTDVSLETNYMGQLATVYYLQKFDNIAQLD